MDLDLKAVLEGRRHLLLDGGMGTMLQKAGLKAGDLPELLNFTDPDEIRASKRVARSSPRTPSGRTG